MIRNPVTLALNKVLTMEKATKNMRNNLRCSSLPYCPILDLERQVNKEYDVESFSMDFYTSIGTSVHEVLQRYLPRQSKKDVGLKFFGSWICSEFSPKCKHSGKLLPLYTNCFRPSKKKRVKDGYWNNNCKDLEYVEVEVNYKGLTGHIDMLVQDEEKNWHLIDFKTTNESKIKSAVSSGSGFGKSKDLNFPSIKYKVQLETYATILRDTMNINISEYHITYISRNILHKPTWGETGSKSFDWFYHDFSFDFTEEMYNFRKAHLDLSIESNKVVGNLLKMEKEKAKEEDVKEMLKKISSLRPCKTLENYFDIMKPAFLQKVNDGKKWVEQECPYKDICCNSNKKTEKLLVDIWNKKED